MKILICLLVAASFQSAPPHDPEPAESADVAWAILKNGLTDKSSDQRAKATHALGLLSGNPKAIDLAVKALSKDPNEDVRAEAATALGLMNARSARGPLIEALKDKDLKVVIAATNSLYLFKDPAAYEVYYAILTGQRKGSEGLIKSQIDMLKDKKQVEMLMLQTGIGFIPFGGMSYEAFRTITHNDSSPVKALAAERLASDPDPRTSAALGRACSDTKWNVRIAVLSAIAKRGDASLLPSVGPLLYDSNDSVRFEAAATVIRLSGKSVHAYNRRRTVRP